MFALFMLLVWRLLAFLQQYRCAIAERDVELLRTVVEYEGRYQNIDCFLESPDVPKQVQDRL